MLSYSNGDLIYMVRRDSMSFNSCVIGGHYFYLFVQFLARLKNYWLRKKVYIYMHMGVSVSEKSLSMGQSNISPLIKLKMTPPGFSKDGH